MNAGPLTFGRAAPTIAVSDIDQALRFYRDLLGLQVTFTNGQPVGFVIVERDRAEIHLTQVPDHRATTANVLHLLVSDATTLFELVSAAGTKIIKGLRDHEYGLRAFVMADPDGNRIDVGQVIETVD